MRFTDLSISQPILDALTAEGYLEPTPIQAKAIPPALDGRDVWGCAQTGTGKTAAFAIPVLQRLAATSRHDSREHGRDNGRDHGRGQRPTRQPRCLVLCPTRELALQIADSFRVYGKGQHVRYTIICGGVSQHPQVADLRRGVDIIVATPGRLKDLIQQRYVDLKSIEMLVLDEADRMLDMGFIPDIRFVCSLIPEKRQTMLFSATMPPAIRKLADSLMTDAVTAEVAAASSTADRIDQFIYPVAKRDKSALLAHLLQTQAMYRTIVFTRTKHGADNVVKKLERSDIAAVAIHGNKSQSARIRALADFANNRVGVLVATDIASRGIDVDGITHVVNFDVTHEPETYVHRIGRTARAGASGVAISFVDREERHDMMAIERLIKRELEVIPSPLPPSQPTHKTGNGYDPDRPRKAPPLPGRGSKGQFNQRRRKRRPQAVGAGAGERN